MHRISRATTLLITFVALQLTLLSGGSACVGMLGESGVLAKVVDAANPASSADMAQDCDAPERRTDAPATGGGACRLMVVCVFAVETPAVVTTAVASAMVPPRVAGLSVRVPAFFVAAPELPPPRA